MICSRSACQEPITIGYNFDNDNTVEGRDYCWACGRKIHELNPDMSWSYIAAPLGHKSYQQICRYVGLLQNKSEQTTRDLVRGLLLRTSFLTQSELYRFFNKVVPISRQDFDKLYSLFPLRT